MRKRQSIPAKRVTVLVDTQFADWSRPVLERFDFLVPENKDNHKLLRFLYSILRKNKIIFREVKIGDQVIGARDPNQLWTRKRMEGCIKNSNRVADMLEEIYCPEYEPVMN